ncbi:helix-turn-helix domain-containing protein [Enterococcus faecalis]|uniref:helix-turn-helix domain-containing protein n=1 Tax=Enterococcus faecalis TaxID=1351 RepID=UPI003D7724EB
MNIFNNYFGNETTKEIELLQVLYKNPRFMNIGELSQSLKMDRRSIYKYFSLLQNKPYIQENKNKDILITKKSYGYRFAGDKKDYKILYQQIIQSNPFFELLESLLVNNEFNIIKFSYDNSISESNIRRRLYELEPLFEDLGFSVKKTSGNAHLLGDESKIRYFMVSFFWRIYHGMHWPFQNVPKDKCEKVVRTIFEQSDLESNDIRIELTCYILAVNIIRFRKGFRIEKRKIESVMSTQYVDSKLLSIILDTENNFVSTLISELSYNYLLNSTEIKFLILWVYSDPRFYLANRDIKEYLNNYSDVERKLERFSQFINEISIKKEIFNFDNLEFKKKLIFLSTIFSGVISVELFGKNSRTLTGYNIEEYILKNFPKLLSRSNLVLENSEVYPNDIDKRNGLALQLALISTLLESPAEFTKKIHIKIDTDLPPIIEFGIIERIQNTFRSYYNIDISSNIAYKDADFCLSTNSLSIDSNQSLDILLINAQVTLSDLLAINKKISSLLSE